MGTEETSVGLNVSGSRQACGAPSVGFGTVGGEHDVRAICCAEAVIFICDEGEWCVFVSLVKIVPRLVRDGRLQSVTSQQWAGHERTLHCVAVPSMPRLVRCMHTQVCHLHPKDARFVGHPQEMK